MFEVLKFIIRCIGQFLAMLFTIDVGFTSLGMVMCICFIFFPIVLTFVYSIKSVLVDELDERYDLNGSLFSSHYVGKHEYKPRHAKRGGK